MISEFASSSTIVRIFQTVWVLGVSCIIFSEAKNALAISNVVSNDTVHSFRLEVLDRGQGDRHGEPHHHHRPAATSEKPGPGKKGPFGANSYKFPDFDLEPWIPITDVDRILRMKRILDEQVDNRTRATAAAASALVLGSGGSEPAAIDHPIKQGQIKANLVEEPPKRPIGTDEDVFDSIRLEHTPFFQPPEPIPFGFLKDESSKYPHQGLKSLISDGPRLPENSSKPQNPLQDDEQTNSFASSTCADASACYEVQSNDIKYDDENNDPVFDIFQPFRDKIKKLLGSNKSKPVRFPQEKPPNDTTAAKDVLESLEVLKVQNNTFTINQFESSKVKGVGNHNKNRLLGLVERDPETQSLATTKRPETNSTSKGGSSASIPAAPLKDPARPPHGTQRPSEIHLQRPQILSLKHPPNKAAFQEDDGTTFRPPRDKITIPSGFEEGTPIWVLLKNDPRKNGRPTGAAVQQTVRVPLRLLDPPKNRGKHVKRLKASSHATSDSNEKEPPGRISGLPNQTPSRQRIPVSSIARPTPHFISFGMTDVDSETSH